MGLIVISHFDNPAQKCALSFLSDVLKWKRKCLIPTTAFLGAYHILTGYLKVERVAAYSALKKTLETRSPAFYEDVNVSTVLDALANAMGYRVESWDGYLIAVARKHSAPVIYTIDEEMRRKVKDLAVVNPIPEDAFREYSEWLREKLGRES